MALSLQPQNTNRNKINNRIMNYLKKLLPLVILLTGTMALNAQKIGYMDYTSVLTDMPAYDSASIMVRTKQAQYQKELEYLTEQRNGKIEKYQVEAANPAADTNYIRILENDARNAVLSYNQREQSISESLKKLEKDLITPIIEGINAVVKKIAAEKGLVYVIDNSTKLLIVKDEKFDITALVRKRLGLKPAVDAGTDGDGK